MRPDDLIFEHLATCGACTAVYERALARPRGRRMRTVAAADAEPVVRPLLHGYS